MQYKIILMQPPGPVFTRGKGAEEIFDNFQQWCSVHAGQLNIESEVVDKKSFMRTVHATSETDISKKLRECAFIVSLESKSGGPAPMVPVFE